MSESIQEIRPLGEYVVVELLPRKSKLLTGIHEIGGGDGLVIPDPDKFHGFRYGKVLKTGPRVKGVSVGDTVVFAREHGQYGTGKTIYQVLSADGVERTLLKWYDLLGVLNPLPDGTLPEVR